MTPDEIIEILRQKGAIISRSTLTNYENAKLIPCPKRGGFGRGRGRYTYYSEDVPQNVYAIYHIANTRKITFWALEKIVCNAFAFEKKPNQLRDGLERLNFSFLDQRAAMSMVLREIIAPALRYVCLKEHYFFGMPEQGIEIIYDNNNGKQVNSVARLYNTGITYGEIVVGNFTLRLAILPSAATATDEAIEILSAT